MSFRATDLRRASYDLHNSVRSNHLLRATDDGLDAARGIFAAVALAAVLLFIGGLCGLWLAGGV